MKVIAVIDRLSAYEINEFIIKKWQSAVVLAMTKRTRMMAEHERFDVLTLTSKQTHFVFLKV